MPAKTVPEHRRTRYLRDERLRGLGYENYTAYIQSPRWKATRARFYRANPGVKCICGAANDLILHHKTYERVGSERLDDLVAVCPDCHSMIHIVERSGLAGLDFESLLDALAAERNRREAALLAVEREEEQHQLSTDLMARLAKLPLAERIELARRTAILNRVNISREWWLFRRYIRDGRKVEAERRFLYLERKAHTRPVGSGRFVG